MAKKTSKEREFPFRKSDNNVIWTLTNGEEVVVSWEEFKEMIKTKEYLALPREEFEQYYKRMKMPKGARDYHRKAKRKREYEHEHEQLEEEWTMNA